MEYKRILLKLSGEALMGGKSYGIDPQRLVQYAQDIAQAKALGTQIAIVIGGGNIFRGLSGTQSGFDRVQGDYMGMLATVINAMALQDALNKAGLKTRVLSGIAIDPLCEAMSGPRAIELLNDGYTVVIAGGTGNPFFTTDTASALRAVEIKADVFLKGTRVDGIYTADPEKDPDAQKFDRITYTEAYERKLHIMDLTAFTMCQENAMPLIVFDMNTAGNLKALIEGEAIGTLVKDK